MAVIGVTSKPDPFALGKFYQGLGPVVPYGNTLARTSVQPSTLTGTTKSILVIGDSLPANSGPTLYSVTQSKNYNFNAGDGAMYVSVDPMLGCSNGVTAPFFSSVCAPLGDNLITGGYCTNAVMIPGGMGSATIADWGVNGGLNRNISAIYNRFVLTGLTLSAIIWHGGPNDTNIGTSQASYTTSLNSLITTIRTYWASTPILIGRCTQAGLGNQSVPIQTAQTSVINNPSGIWAGVNSDSYAAGNFVDGTHFNPTGRTQWATDAITQLHAAGVI